MKIYLLHNGKSFALLSRYPRSTPTIPVSLFIFISRYSAPEFHLWGFSLGSFGEVKRGVRNFLLEIVLLLVLCIIFNKKHSTKDTAEKFRATSAWGWTEEVILFLKK